MRAEGGVRAMRLLGVVLCVLFGWQCTRAWRKPRRVAASRSRPASSAEVVVSRELYENVTSAALAEARRVAREVDGTCVAGISTEPRGLLFVDGVGKATTPRLCRVDLARVSLRVRAGAGERSAQGVEVESSSKASVLMMVNSVSYLLLEGNWLAFVNKAAYCRATRRRFYVWIGELRASVRDARNPVPWMRCAHATGNTLNIYKALAFLVLLDTESEIVYMDADAWFSDSAFRRGIELDDYLFRPEAFLFGNQNRYGGPRIPMNGGILALRRTRAAEKFLALWFYSRCGPHDQLPLWATLFATAAAATPDPGLFPLSPALLSRYKYAHHRAVEILADAADALRAAVGFDSQPWDGGHFRETHIVDAPLELPGPIVILPTAPLALPGRAPLPALRSDLNASAPTFCCHTRLDKEEGHKQCLGSHICSTHKCAPFYDSS